MLPPPLAKKIFRSVARCKKRFQYIFILLYKNSILNFSIGLSSNANDCFPWKTSHSWGTPSAAHSPLAFTGASCNEIHTLLPNPCVSRRHRIHTLPSGSHYLGSPFPHSCAQPPLTYPVERGARGLEETNMRCASSH